MAMNPGYAEAKADIIKLLDLADSDSFRASVSIHIDGHLAVVVVKTEDLVADILEK